MPFFGLATDAFASGVFGDGATPKSIAGEEAAGNTRGDSIDAGDAKGGCTKAVAARRATSIAIVRFARAWSE